jgi:hypothetical protein
MVSKTVYTMLTQTDYELLLTDISRWLFTPCPGPHCADDLDRVFVRKQNQTTNGTQVVAYRLCVIAYTVLTQVFAVHSVSNPIIYICLQNFGILLNHRSFVTQLCSYSRTAYVVCKLLESTFESALTNVSDRLSCI